MVPSNWSSAQFNDVLWKAISILRGPKEETEYKNLLNVNEIVTDSHNIFLWHES